MRLTLIRHAKSSWGDPTQSDHARPLNARGRRDAPKLGRWLLGHAPLPQVILCSDAARTRETCALLTAQWPDRPEIRYEPRLYLAEPATIAQLVAEADSPNAAVIAHNPGIGALAHHLARTTPDHPRFDDYPTAATTILETDLAPGTANVIAFTTPHSL